MSPAIRQCALISRFADTRVAESTLAVAAHLHSRGIAVLVPIEDGELADQPGAVALPESELAARADLVVAVGGDGTLLYAAGLVAEQGTPSSNGGGVDIEHSVHFKAGSDGFPGIHGVDVFREEGIGIFGCDIFPDWAVGAVD